MPDPPLKAHASTTGPSFQTCWCLPAREPDPGYVLRREKLQREKWRWRNFGLEATLPSCSVNKDYSRDLNIIVWRISETPRTTHERHGSPTSFRYTTPWD